MNETNATNRRFQVKRYTKTNREGGRMEALVIDGGEWQFRLGFVVKWSPSVLFLRYKHYDDRDDTGVQSWEIHVGRVRVGVGLAS